MSRIGPGGPGGFRVLPDASGKLDTPGVKGRTVGLSRAQRPNHPTPNIFDRMARAVRSWDNARAARRSEQKLSISTESLLRQICDGAIIVAPALLSHMSRHAERLQPGAGPARLRAAFTEQMARLPAGDRDRLCCADFSQLKTAAQRQRHAALDRLAELNRSLGEAGLRTGGGVDVVKIFGARSDAADPLSVLKDVAREMRVANLRATFGGVFSVDDRGVVSGAMVNRPLPEHCTKGLRLDSRHEAFTPAAFIEARGRARLDGAGKRENLAAVAVLENIAADWPSMNVTFDNGNASFSTYKSSVDELVGKAEVFAGSKNAVSVLSAILHQHELRSLLCAESNNAGDALFVMPVSARSNPFVVRDVGVIERPEGAPQRGAVKFNIAINEKGDFIIAMAYDMLISHARLSDGDDRRVDPRAGGSEWGVPVQCLEVSIAATFIVSGKAAAEGRLEIDPASTFTKSYSGAFAMPA